MGNIALAHDPAFLASEARRLRDEPLLVKALAEMEARTVDDLISCNADDRAELIIVLRVIRGFRTNLSAIIAEGGRPQRGGVA